jgi:hypothetical protein
LPHECLSLLGRNLDCYKIDLKIRFQGLHKDIMFVDNRMQSQYFRFCAENKETMVKHSKYN